MVGTCFGAPSTLRSFFCKKHLNLNFWWYFKVSRTNYLWANIGSYGQSWSNFAALVMVDYMPYHWLKFVKPHNSKIISPNIMCSNSFGKLRSTSIYILSLKCTRRLLHPWYSLPKIAKSQFVFY
jgi:hypothetical protein